MLIMGAVVVPNYISEISPSSKRGSYVSINQLTLSASIPIAYWIDLAFAHAQLNWRPVFGVECIPAILLAIGMIFLPESPHWLAHSGYSCNQHCGCCKCAYQTWRYFPTGACRTASSVDWYPLLLVSSTGDEGKEPGSDRAVLGEWKEVVKEL